MDNEIIEKIARNIVEREILRFDECLSPYVNSNDKTPSWDGNIYVYNNQIHAVKNYEGKIETQIKGKKVEKLSKGNTKFKFEVDTLNAYRKNICGTLLLYVEFIDIDNYQIYYRNLLPVDLIEIFKTIKSDQSTKMIDLRPVVPKSGSSLKYVCLNFLKNSNKQPNRRLISEEEIRNLEEIKIEVISSYEYLEDYLKNGPIYSYGVLKDTKEIVNLPLLKDIHVFHTMKHIVVLDDEEIEVNFTESSGSEDESIIIGKSLILRKQINKLEIKLSGTLNERINDLKLLIYILKYKKINTKNGILNFPLIDDEESEKAYHYFESVLKDYIRIRNTFNYFNVDFNIDMSKLSEKDINSIYLLTDLLEGKNLETINEYKLYHITIQNYKIIFLPKMDNEKVIGIYNLFEDLTDKIKFYIYNSKGEIVDMSVFYLLSPDTINTASNFNHAMVLEDILKRKITKDACPNCNEFILNLLLAYDISNDKRHLELAEKIADELIKTDNSDIYKLNLYQIKYRTIGLDRFDKEKIKEIYDRGTEFEKCGASILLNNITDYELSFDKLTPEEQSLLVNYPICNLIK